MATRVLQGGRKRIKCTSWWEGPKEINVGAIELVADDGKVYYLVWPFSFDARIDIEWTTDNKTISFEKIRGVDRLALVSRDLGVLIQHWIAPKVPGQKKMVIPVISIDDECANPDELKFSPGPLLTGTGKPGRVLTGAFGDATGGVPPYAAYRGKFRRRDAAGEEAWRDITDWSTQDNQTYTVQPSDVDYKINFYQEIQDACGQTKFTGSSKNIVAE